MRKRPPSAVAILVNLTDAAGREPDPAELMNR